MSKLLRQNVGGTDYTMVGCALTGVCSSAAADYIKSVTLSDGDILSDGMTVIVAFANGNAAGTAPASMTIYSSDQVNYFIDSALTQPFTLAPAGCYEITYTGEGNAYSYISYPVIQIGSITGKVCDTRGKPVSGSQWDAGDRAVFIYSGGDFFILPVTTDVIANGNVHSVASNAVNNALKNFPVTTYYNYAQTQNLNCNDIEDRVALVTTSFEGALALNYPTDSDLCFIFTSKTSYSPTDGVQKAISYASRREWNRTLINGVWSDWVEVATSFDGLNIFDDTYYPSSFRFTVSNDFKGKFKVEVFDANNAIAGSLDCIFYSGNILIKEQNSITYDLASNILTLTFPSSAYCKHYIHADIIQGFIVSASYI